MLSHTTKQQRKRVKLNATDTCMTSTGANNNVVRIKHTPRYLVEKIVDQKVENGELKYLLKWQGRVECFNTWVLATNVSLDIINEFHRNSLKVGAP